MNRELGSTPDSEGALDLPQAVEVVPSNGIVLMDVAAFFDPDSVGFQVGVEVAQTLVKVNLYLQILLVLNI